MIRELKKFLNYNNLDGYLVPKNDAYFTEYSKINNLAKLSKFTGSAGFSLVLKKKNYLLLMADILSRRKNNQGMIFKY